MLPVMHRALTMVWLICVCACSPSDPQASAHGDPPMFRRIVLISIDTLRADHLGAYGYPRPVSPFIDSLASRGVVFERAHASMATTTPSHATMFTGLHPIQHGVLRNGRRVSDDARTLAEHLTERGYRTAGFSSTRSHFGRTNLAQGFGHFDEVSPEDGHRRGADATVDAALAWLADPAVDDPLFLFVHLYDVHHPWEPPDADREQAAIWPAGSGPEYWSQVQFIPPDFYPEGPERLHRSLDAYDGEIHFVDRQLRRIEQALAARPDAPTLWIVTADHGEGLGNHDWLFHGKHIYQEQIRVPLIVHASDGRFPSRRVRDVVGHVDLFPTLLELVPPAAPAQSADPVPDRPGRSLVPALLGTDAGSVQAFAQRRQFDPDPVSDARAARGELPSDHRYEPGETYALVVDDWKLIHRTRGADELFDLAADPYETDNRIEREPERARELMQELRRQLDRFDSQRAQPAEPVDPETAESLEALGYLP